MPAMRISTVDEITNRCFPRALNAPYFPFGCSDDCVHVAPSDFFNNVPSISEGDIVGDYLHIPGGMYNDVVTSSTSTYQTDYYCGIGLANDRNMVIVKPSGPASVRS